LAIGNSFARGAGSLDTCHNHPADRRLGEGLEIIIRHTRSSPGDNEALRAQSLDAGSQRRRRDVD